MNVNDRQCSCDSWYFCKHDINCKTIHEVYVKYKDQGTHTGELLRNLFDFCGANLGMKGPNNTDIILPSNEHSFCIICEQPSDVGYCVLCVSCSSIAINNYGYIEGCPNKFVFFMDEDAKPTVIRCFHKPTLESGILCDFLEDCEIVGCNCSYHYRLYGSYDIKYNNCKNLPIRKSIMLLFIMINTRINVKLPIELYGLIMFQ